MVAEARLAERLEMAGSGLAEEIAGTVVGLGLPIEIPPDLPHSDILQAMWYDKKKDSEVVCFTLPVGIGEIRVGVEVENLNLIFPEV
jgi:3-dehydroquinate synthetase